MIVELKVQLRRLFQEGGVEVGDVFLDQVAGLVQGAAWDRDKARERLFEAHPTDWSPSDRWVEDVLDALEACVVPVPAHTIDRDALHASVAQAMGYEPDSQMPNVYEVEARILALLRPVEGVVLSREEAERASAGLHIVALMPGGQSFRALAERLEALS